MEKLTRNELFKYCSMLKRKVWELNDADFALLVQYQNRFNAEYAELR